MNEQAGTAGETDATIGRICSQAWARAPATTARLQAAGFGPGRWPGWIGLEALDVMDKGRLAASQQGLAPLGGLNAERAGCLFLSTGGIMEPDLPAAEARLAAWFRRCGLVPGDVVLNGFSYHLTPAGLLFHAAARLVGCLVLPAGPQNADATLELARRGGATAFVGIAGHLKLLLTRAEELGLVVGRDLALRIAFAGGEPFGGPIRSQLTERHKVTCFDFYGSADVGVVAGETAGRAGYELFDGVVAEVLDPQTQDRLPEGEAGHLVLSVDNPTYPLLRLGTGDVAALHGRRLIGPFGRVDSSARVRGLLLYEKQVLQALAAHPAIAGGWVEVDRQHDRDGIVALLDAPDEAWAEVAEAFQAAFRAACRLSVDRVDHAPAAAAGPALRDKRFRTA